MTDFDIETANLHFNISQLPLAYEQKDEGSMKRWMPEGDLEVRFVRHENSTAAIVYYKDDKKIVISFDGALEFGDIIDDINVFPTEHVNGGNVRSGYLNAIMKENDAGEYFIDALSYTVKDITKNTKSKINMDLVGFSKAGSMAQMVASTWLVERKFIGDDKITLNEVYAYGSPHVGDKVFVQNFEDMMEQENVALWRVDYGNDIIPHPFYPLPFDMVHAGRSVLLVPITEDTTAVIVDGNKKITEPVREILSDMDSDYHNIEKYKQALTTIDPEMVTYKKDREANITLNNSKNKPVLKP